MSNELPPMSGMGSEPPGFPARVEPVGYFTPAQYLQRPGILTAVGILSIVLASLGLLSNCAGVGSAMLIRSGFYSRLGAMSRPVPATAPSTGPYATYQPPLPANSRMSAEHRAAAVSAFNERLSLSPASQAMLDKLLDATGDDPFPFGEETFTAEKLGASVNSSGTSTAGGVNRSWYITPNGRIEVDDQYAVYMPNQGTTIEVPTPTAAAPRYPTYPGMQVSSTAISITTPSAGISTFQLIVAALNLLSSGYLLYCGIKVVKDSPSGRRVHLLYAAIKIPLVLSSVILGWITTLQMYSSNPIGTFPIKTFVVVSMVISSTVLLVYPVALIIIMTRARIIEYYDALLAEKTGTA